MKIIISLTLLAVSLCGSVAFGATLLVSGSASTSTTFPDGYSIYAGNSEANATAAVSPQIKLSSKVRGAVAWDLDAADGAKATSYKIVTKHTTGSRQFGTTNDATTLYYKLDTSGTSLTDIGTTTTAATAFVGGGWTGQ